MKKHLALIFLVGSLALMLFFATMVDIDEAERKVQDWLESLGVWAWVIYAAAFALLEPLGVPAVLFIIPASVVWGPWVALGLSLPAACLAALLGFVYARFLARQWVEERLPARLKRFNSKLEQGGGTAFLAVVTVRILFFLFPPTHWLFGLSRIGLTPFLIGTLIGLMPAMLGLAFLGGGLASWLTTQPPWIWGWVLAAFVMIVMLRRRLKRNRRDA
jgi:uncharacterized membrane protein YdjX (TVP38/TMEM64 family)